MIPLHVACRAIAGISQAALPARPGRFSPTAALARRKEAEFRFVSARAHSLTQKSPPLFPRPRLAGPEPRPTCSEAMDWRGLEPCPSGLCASFPQQKAAYLEDGPFDLLQLRRLPPPSHSDSSEYNQEQNHQKNEDPRENRQRFASGNPGEGFWRRTGNDHFCPPQQRMSAFERVQAFSLLAIRLVFISFALEGSPFSLKPFVANGLPSRIRGIFCFS
jgi:hypothetical protein